LIILQAGELSTAFKKSIWSPKLSQHAKGYGLLNQLKSRDNLLTFNTKPFSYNQPPYSQNLNNIPSKSPMNYLSAKLKPLIKYSLTQNNFLLNDNYAPLFKFVF